jgi:hypothetical protein
MDLSVQNRLKKRLGLNIFVALEKMLVEYKAFISRNGPSVSDVLLFIENLLKKQEEDIQKRMCRYCTETHCAARINQSAYEDAEKLREENKVLRGKLKSITDKYTGITNVEF